jgi:hypothetical protein
MNCALHNNSIESLKSPFQSSFPIEGITIRDVFAEWARRLMTSRSRRQSALTLGAQARRALAGDWRCFESHRLNRTTAPSFSADLRRIPPLGRRKTIDVDGHSTPVTRSLPATRCSQRPPWLQCIGVTALSVESHHALPCRRVGAARARTASPGSSASATSVRYCALSISNGECAP